MFEKCVKINLHCQLMPIITILDWSPGWGVGGIEVIKFVLFIAQVGFFNGSL